MFKKKVIFSVAVCLLAALLVSQGLSQPAQQGQGQGRGRGGQNQQGQGGNRQFDPEQMQRMMEQRLQEQLGASDAEWKEIGPLVMKVQELSRQSAGRGRMMYGGMGGRRGMRGDRPGGQNAQGDRPRGRQGQNQEMTAVEKASDELSTLLENTSATPEQIKEKLGVLRAAKAKEKEALVAAQKALQEKATPRQEAQLVLMGLLD